MKSQLFVRKRSFSFFVKSVQNVISEISNKEGWAKVDLIIEALEAEDFDFNPLNYGFNTTNEAFDAIHGGWLEFKEVKKTKYVKVNKVMP
ncbi:MULTISPECIES: hypothetical protein [Acinetobacter]|uniref:hypothetical protein n=1 Tax=Acinetobacter TaxID=469 RepID=UPI0005366A98|nr:hypothetical protein [Acinetobacter sp. HR7]KGT48077.1 hypothetical protein GW12_08690 [Acinetobacter sp. HR7]